MRSMFKCAFMPKIMTRIGTYSKNQDQIMRVILNGKHAIKSVFDG